MGVPLIALLAIGAIVLSGGGGQEDPAASDGRQNQKEAGDEGRSAGLQTPTLGSADAPVVLTEYSDYQ